MIALFFCILLLTVSYIAIKKKDFFSPLVIYISVFSFILFIYSFNLSRYQTKWAPETNMLFWGSIFVFIGTVFSVKTFFRLSGRNFIGFEEIRLSVSQQIQELDWTRFKLCFYVIAGIYLIGFTDALIIAGQVPFLSKNADGVRVNFVLGSKIFAHAWLCGSAALMLGFEYILLSPEKISRKLPLVLIAILVLVSYFSILTRVDLFRFFIFAVILFHYTKKRISARMLAVILVVAFIFFVSIFFVRGQNIIAFARLATAIKAKIPLQFMWFTAFYTYVVNNLWNFDYVIQQYCLDTAHYHFGYGYEFFKPLLQILNLEGTLSNVYRFDTVFNESAQKVSGMNTIVYMWHFYKDLGPFGVYFFTVFYGTLVSFFYYNTFCCKPTLTRIGIWGIISGMLFFSFLAEFWAMWFPYMNMLLIFLAHKKGAANVDLNKSIAL